MIRERTEKVYWLVCDGVCGGFHSTRIKTNVDDLEFMARRQGWSTYSTGDQLCPECTRKRRGRAPEQSP